MQRLSPKNWKTDTYILGLVWISFLLVMVFTHEKPSLHAGEIVYMVLRGVLAVVLLYGLVPRFLYKGEYALFCFFTLLATALFGSFEEGVIEPFFFPYTRGADPLSVTGVIYAAIETMPMLAVMTVIKLAWDSKEAQKNLVAVHSEKVESELKFLRSQINPHILFNALNNIYSHSLTDTGKAPDMLLKLSDLLRYTLYECGEDLVPLDRELASIKNYIAIQEMGLEGRGFISLEIEGETQGKSILPFVLITLVENCFKHSFDTQEKGIEISIHVQVGEAALTLKTRNSFDEDTRAESEGVKEKGVGIANVRRRLELQSGGEFSLEHGQKGDVYELELRMPLGAEGSADV